MSYIYGWSTRQDSSTESDSDSDTTFVHKKDDEYDEIRRNSQNVRLLNNLRYRSPAFIASCMSIKGPIQKIDKVVSVCPSYSFLAKIIFLIFTKNEEKLSLPPVYDGLNVKFRKIGYQNNENDSNVTSDVYLNTELTTAASEELNKILIDNYERLFAMHSNLVSITASSVTSRKFGERDAELITLPCFVLFIPVKGYIPIDGEEFPTPTDVREGTFKLYWHRAQKYHQTLRMGCAISGPKNDQGTLSVFVDQNGQLCFITSAHVLLFESAYTQLKTSRIFDNCTLRSTRYTRNNMIDVYQPVVDKSYSLPIGHIAKAIYRTGDKEHAGVESVLVELTDTHRYPNAGTFPDGDFMDTGFSNAKPMTFTSGEVVDQSQTLLNRFEVLKYGSQTGITQGMFKKAGPSVHREVFNDGKGVVLLNQLQILGTSECPFAEPGDSGALVLVAHAGNDQDLRALGIVTGGMGKSVCFVTQIWDVLHALESDLNFKLTLKQF